MLPHPFWMRPFEELNDGSHSFQPFHLQIDVDRLSAPVKLEDYLMQSAYPDGHMYGVMADPFPMSDDAHLLRQGSVELSPETSLSESDYFVSMADILPRLSVISDPDQYGKMDSCLQLESSPGSERVFEEESGSEEHAGQMLQRLPSKSKMASGVRRVNSHKRSMSEPDFVQSILSRRESTGSVNESAPKIYSRATIMGDPNDRKFDCPRCDKKYRNMNGLKYHLAHVHAVLEGIPLEVLLADRKRELEGSKHKPFECPIDGCDKRYKNPNGLKYHLDHAHENVIVDSLPGDVPVRHRRSKSMSSRSPSEPNAPSVIPQSGVFVQDQMYFMSPTQGFTNADSFLF